MHLDIRPDSINNKHNHYHYDNPHHGSHYPHYPHHPPQISRTWTIQLKPTSSRKGDLERLHTEPTMGPRGRATGLVGLASTSRV